MAKPEIAIIFLLAIGTIFVPGPGVALGPVKKVLCGQKSLHHPKNPDHCQTMVMIPLLVTRACSYEKVYCNKTINWR